MSEYVVYRNIGLPVSVFDKLKEIQRVYKEQGIKLNNSELIAKLITTESNKLNDTVREDNDGQ